MRQSAAQPERARGRATRGVATRRDETPCLATRRGAAPRHVAREAESAARRRGPPRTAGRRRRPGASWLDRVRRGSRGGRGQKKMPGSARRTGWGRRAATGAEKIRPRRPVARRRSLPADAPARTRGEPTTSDREATEPADDPRPPGARREVAGHGAGQRRGAPGGAAPLLLGSLEGVKDEGHRLTSRSAPPPDEARAGPGACSAAPTSRSPRFHPPRAPPAAGRP